MKIKHRIISALTAAAAAFSLMSTAAFASNSRYDVNEDGYVNSKDALYILKEFLFNDNKDPKLDVNRDGFVNANDSLFVLKVALGMIEPEPEVTEPETPAAESILDDYTKKWGYNTLSDKQKAAYELILDGALKNKSSISLRELNITVSDLKKAFWACDYDNPKLLNIDSGYGYTYSGSRIYSIEIQYGKTASQTATALANVEAKTADIIARAKKLPSDYDRVKLFHDWIINNTVYTLTGSKYISETDGPILYGKALCEGYSRAFEYLCQSVGIECVCISGEGNGGGHMWNMVKVDGEWYHIDVTWDDPITTTGEQVLRYNYFLVSDAKIKENHTISNNFEVPTAPNTYAG